MKKEAKQFQAGLGWYCVYCQPRQETVATAALQQNGYEVFFPRLRRRRYHNSQASWVVEPMFPRYIFVRLDLSQSHADVGYQRGVVRLVNFNGNYPSLPDQIVADLRAAGDCDVVTSTPHEFQPGDLMEVQEGPWRGFQATFLRESNAEARATILLNILGQAVEAEIERELLEKV